MNIAELIKTDNQVIRALHKALQEQAELVEFKNYDDMNIESKKDFYIAISQAAEILIEGEDGE